MKTLRRLFGAVIAFLLLLILVVAGAVFFLLGTETGQTLVRNRAELALANLVGPQFETHLGTQNYELRPDGSLAITWSDVTMAPRAAPDSRTVVDHFAVAIRLIPLMSGGALEFGRFEVSGARVDLDSLILPPPETTNAPAQTPEQAIAETAAPEPSRTLLGRTASGLIESAERHLGLLRTFHFDTIEFSNIAITGLPGLEGPADDLHIERAELRRSEAGELQLLTSFDLGLVPITMRGNASFSEQTGRLQQMNLQSGKLQLKDAFPPAPESDEHDERPFGSDAPFEVALRLARDADDAPLAAELDLTAEAGAIQIGSNHTRVEKAALHLRYRSDEEEITILPSPMQFRDVAFTATGTVNAAAAGPDLSLDRLAFRVGTDDLRSRVGSADEHGASLWLEGIFDPVQKLLQIQKGSLQAGAGTLSGTASLGYGRPSDMARLNLTGQNLTSGDIKAFWPFNIGGRARRWVIAHMGDAAQLPSASIVINARRDRLQKAFGKISEARPDEFAIDVDIREADLSTIGDLPDLYHGNGRLELRGNQTRITLDDAMVEGMEAVALGQSSVFLHKPAEGDRRDLLIDLDINASGNARQLLEIAAREPLNAIEKTGIKPEKATGTGSVQAQAFLRVGRFVSKKEQLLDWKVVAKLADAAPGSPIEGRDLQNMKGELTIVPGLVSGALQAGLDGIPGEIDLAIPFGERAAEPREINVRLAMNGERTASLVAGLAGVVNGNYTLNADLVDGSTHLSADLTGASLQIPTVAWSKGAGIAAKLSLDLVPQGDGSTRLNAMSLSGEGFSATGSAIIDDKGLRSADLGKMALNPGDSVALKARRTDAGLAIDVSGQKFDARPILQDLKSTAGQDRTGKRARGALDIVANIDTLAGFNNTSLSNFALNYASRNGRLTGLSVSGVIGQGQIGGDLSRRDGVEMISLSSANTGALLAFSGLYAHMQGGGGLLELSGTMEQGYVGQLRMRDFTLVDEPRLARIVGSTPVEGQSSLSQAVGQDLRTSRAFFDQAAAELVYSKGALKVSNGIVRGPNFGSSFAGQLYDRSSTIDISGSFMPAYGLNRVFGALPLVGQILGNGNEGGLIGITYRLSGPFGSPTLTVNPISLIAPGIFRQIFAYE